MKTLSISKILTIFIFTLFYGCALTPITTEITSEPKGANIYWGPSKDELTLTGHVTPYIETINPQPGQFDLHWQDWYYQIKKDGFYDSEIIFQKETTGDRKVHFKLKQKFQLSVSATGAVGTLERITVNGPEEDYPRLSPDQKWLLIEAKGIGPKSSKNTVLQKLDLVSGPRVILTPKNTDAINGDWLPNQTGIVYASNRSGTYTIVQSFGTEGESGVKFISPLSFGHSQFPHVSPDGKQVTFTLRSKENNQICAIDIDGKNLRIFGEGEQSQWSPNGKTLVFRRNVGDLSHIFKIDANTGTNLVEITSGVSIDHSPSWSPNGEYISFISYRSNNSHLYIMDQQGRNITQLTDGIFDVLSASWGSDGYIYFSSNAGGNNDIWRLKPKFKN